MSGRRAREARRIAQQDQIDAAVRNAEWIHRSLPRLVSKFAGQEMERHASPWLMDVLAASLLIGDRCGHLGSPQPVAVMAWSPGLWCTTCAAAEEGRTVTGTAQEYVCDVCGEYRPSDVHAVAAQHGPYLLAAGACSGCRHVVVPEDGAL